MTFLIRNFWMTYIAVCFSSPFYPPFSYYKHPIFFRMTLCPATRLAFVVSLQCSLRGCLLGCISVFLSQVPLFPIDWFPSLCQETEHSAWTFYHLWLLKSRWNLCVWVAEETEWKNLRQWCCGAVLDCPPLPFSLHEENNLFFYYNHPRRIFWCVQLIITLTSLHKKQFISHRNLCY